MKFRHHYPCGSRNQLPGASTFPGITSVLHWNPSGSRQICTHCIYGWKMFRKGKKQEVTYHSPPSTLWRDTEGYRLTWTPFSTEWCDCFLRTHSDKNGVSDVFNGFLCYFSWWWRTYGKKIKLEIGFFCISFLNSCESGTEKNYSGKSLQVQATKLKSQCMHVFRLPRLKLTLTHAYSLLNQFLSST